LNLKIKVNFFALKILILNFKKKLLFQVVLNFFNLLLLFILPIVFFYIKNVK
jgi:hypothetical protein